METECSSPYTQQRVIYPYWGRYKSGLYLHIQFIYGQPYNYSPLHA